MRLLVRFGTKTSSCGRKNFSFCFKLYMDFKTNHHLPTHVIFLSGFVCITVFIEKLQVFAEIVDRNFAVGEADEESAKAYEITWQATEAGLAVAKPGITCADLFEAMQEVMAPHAIASSGDVGRLGHGLGMQLTEFPSHTFWDETVLREGMVLTLEPGYAFAEGKMMVHEENIVIRKEGAELLTKRAARTMPIIGAHTA